MEAFSHQWKITPIGKNKRGGMFVIWMNYFTFTIFTFPFLFTLVRVFLLHFPLHRETLVSNPSPSSYLTFPLPWKQTWFIFPLTPSLTHLFPHLISFTQTPSPPFLISDPVFQWLFLLRSGISMAIPYQIRRFNGDSFSDLATTMCSQTQRVTYSFRIRKIRTKIALTRHVAVDEKLRVRDG